jgi:MinD superfamily P-loop ATPase
MIICWSSKGGSGTTVVSAALAILSSASHPTTLVDLCGDLPAALGVAEPSGPGVADWMQSPVATDTALGTLATEVTPDLHLLHRGHGSFPPHRWSTLADNIAASLHGNVVIDAGTLVPPPELRHLADSCLLVVRPCYLALRRAIADAPSLESWVTGVVLVTEPGRALRSTDVARSLGVPVVAEIPLDPSVARAVDAGMLLSRLPRTLSHPLAGVTR